ncbi:MAG: DegV family protein [Anaerolineae bacterium]|nr:DegV family protein [Anaerolineae bacterium]
MKIGIVTDSTCDLPNNIVNQLGIKVVPAVLVLDGKAYVDGNGITRKEFYTRLPDFKSLPTTSAPSIGEFSERYEKLIKAGCDHIISIHAAHQLTNIFNTSRLAAKDFGDRIKVIDSGSLSLGLGFQVLAAAEAALEDVGLDAIYNAIKSTRARQKVIAALDTMKYLKRIGRVHGTKATLAGILSLKPIVALKDGEILSLGTVRTTQQAGARIYKTLQELGPLERLAILHSNAETRALQLLDELMNTIRQSIPRKILMVNVTTVIGTHVGPNGLGFAAVIH